MYLLEDEQELSLGMLIRLQRIYNFWLFHAVILSFYSNFISFFGANLLTKCLVPVAIFCLFFTSQKINIKQSPNAAKLFGDFFGPEDIQWAREAPRGAPRGAQPTRAHLGAQARPGGLCPPRGTPLVLLRPILCLLAQKNSPKSFAAFGLRLVLISCDVKNKQKTATGTGHYVNRLVPKNYIKWL